MRELKRYGKAIIEACSRQKSLKFSSSTDTELSRCLSTLDLTFIGIGGTLGSGIYVLTGEVAKNKAGPAIVLSFLIAGFVSILSGLCYAEFGARIPKAGSAYVYCYLTVGELCAFIVGWNIIMEYIIGGAAIARSLSAYVDSLAGGAIQNGTLTVFGDMHVAGFSHYFDALAFATVLIFTVMLSLGVKNSARFNNFCVTVNILTVALVALVGFFYAKPENWHDFAPYGFPGIVAGASTCFFAFIGFDVIATTCEEAKNPAKSIPISMVATINTVVPFSCGTPQYPFYLAICCLAYLGVSGAITLMVSYKDLDELSAVASAFHQRGLKFMGYVIGAGATTGLLGCTLISMVPLPRLLYAMSQDGMVMKFFSKVHPKTQIPIVATIVSGLSIGLLAALLDLDELVEMLSIGTLLAYSIVDVCVILLRYKNTSIETTASEEYKIREEEIMLNSHAEVSSIIKNDERTILLEKHVQDENNCLTDGCTFQSNPSLVNIVMVSIVFILFGISIVLSKYIEKIAEKNVAFVLILLTLVLMLISCCFYLSRLPTYTEGLSFKVPLVPLVPVMALFFNLYLMLSLSKLTWLRLAVWMAIGFVVYFGYSMHHSAEKVTSTDPEDGYVLLDMQNKKSSSSRTSSPIMDPTVVTKSPNKID